MGFQIDEDKLRSALPTPTSTTGEDLKWSSAFLLVAVLVIAGLAAIGWFLISLLRH